MIYKSNVTWTDGQTNRQTRSFGNQKGCLRKEAVVESGDQVEVFEDQAKDFGKAKVSQELDTPLASSLAV